MSMNASKTKLVGTLDLRNPKRIRKIFSIGEGKKSFVIRARVTATPGHQVLGIERGGDIAKPKSVKRVSIVIVHSSKDIN